MIVRPVDDRHAHLFALEFLGRLESSKAGPDDDDMRFWRLAFHARESSRIKKCDARRLFAQAANLVGKRLSLTETALSCAPYAQAHCAQQDPKIGRETFQDHRDWKSFALAVVAPAFAFLEERETETPVRQGGVSGCNGRCADQSESAFCLTNALARIARRFVISFSCAIGESSQPSALR